MSQLKIYYVLIPCTNEFVIVMRDMIDFTALDQLSTTAAESISACQV